VQLFVATPCPFPFEIRSVLKKPFHFNISHNLRKLPSSISKPQATEHHSSIKEIILKLRKDMDIERNFDFGEPIDQISLSLPSTKRNRLDPSEEDQNQNTKHFITVFSDPILDEAADEVAEELEWELILQQWNIECENLPCLINA
jgi:hypothetical protein